LLWLTPRRKNIGGRLKRTLTLPVKGQYIPVRFIKTNQGWTITDAHGNTIKEVGVDHPDVPGPALTEHWYYTYYLIQARKRREKDALGELAIPADIYYGIHTERGRRNFDVSKDTIGHWPNYLRCLAMLKKAAPIFARRCIAGIEVNEAVCREQAGNTLSVSSVISAVLGYEKGVEVSRFTRERKISIGRAAVELGLLSQPEDDELFDPMTLTDAERSAEAIRRSFVAQRKKVTLRG